MTTHGNDPAAVRAMVARLVDGLKVKPPPPTPSVADQIDALAAGSKNPLDKPSH